MKRYLSPEALSKALHLLRQEPGGTDLVVAGGLAMQEYGSDRLTGDLDLLARSIPAALVAKFTKGKRSATPLSFGGVRFKVNGIPVDILVRDDDLQWLYREAHHLAILHQKSNVSMEHLAVMKMAAGRDKDLLDLNFLLTHPQLKYTHARGIAVEYLGWYAGKELDARRAEAQWRKKTGL